MSRRLFLLISSSAVVAGALGGMALAHSWYPIQCCDDDCYAVADEDVQLTGAGWRIVATGEVVAFGRVAFSPDGRFHRCSEDGEIGGRTLCLFVPRLGS
jgi:hypothetical protein